MTHRLQTRIDERNAKKRAKHNPLIGKCYQACAIAITSSNMPEGWVMVHGEPTLTIKPFVKYGHAWLENRKLGLAHDVVVGITAPIADYYRDGQIDPCSDNHFEYTSEQTREMLNNSEHWGAWEGTHSTPG